MKLNIVILFILSLTFLSCNRIANKTKEGINKGGEVVGETATEFIEGVTEGVDKTLECEIFLSKNLKSKGLKTSTYNIESQPIVNNNKLTLYIIFNKNFNNNVMVKAFNKNKLEIGRARTLISGKKGDAGYFDFEFDERTDIGFRNIITIE
ncbi:hypothetical protein [Winogradskyella sp. PG-2]|uniref:hypothetical protein n=1 Tax=Winogradskyella sp. PG-2 TaxID=754409 RepID=UPI0004586A33|nr:hypothetical protein [Winogradskyella sp. PG-2]BAO77175.1 hypothetical protein WPG_2945 [Winogradskyella sp. PG-2]